MSTTGTVIKSSLLIEVVNVASFTFLSWSVSNTKLQWCVWSECNNRIKLIRWYSWRRYWFELLLSDVGMSRRSFSIPIVSKFKTLVQKWSQKALSLNELDEDLHRKNFLLIVVMETWGHLRLDNQSFQKFTRKIDAENVRNFWYAWIHYLKTAGIDSSGEGLQN